VVDVLAPRGDCLEFAMIMKDRNCLVKEAAREKNSVEGRARDGSAGDSAPKVAAVEISAEITVEATVKEALPNALFKVELATGQAVQAHLSPELRIHVVRVLPGDRVRLELSPHDWGRGRIIARLR